MSVGWLNDFGITRGVDAILSPDLEIIREGMIMVIRGDAEADVGKGSLFQGRERRGGLFSTAALRINV